MKAFLDRIDLGDPLSFLLGALAVMLALVVLALVFSAILAAMDRAERQRLIERRKYRPLPDPMTKNAERHRRSLS